MIPYCEILEKYTRKAFDIVEPSEIWCELSYYGVGEFEIFTRATTRAITALQIGNYVKIPNTAYIFVIEQINPLYDADSGLMISASGRQAKAILDKRIINVQTQLSHDLVTTVNALINKHAGTGAGVVRRIGGLSTTTSTVSQAISETQVSYDNLLTYTDALLKSYECGAALDIVGEALIYRIYKGVDRSESVIFSQMFDNLLDSSYIVNDRNYRNFAVVGGQGEGNARIMQNVDLNAATGIDRNEIFIDAKDISNKYTDSNGDEQELDLTTAAGMATYRSWLNERGKVKLANYTRVESFDGTIDTVNSVFKFGVDYNIGDIVRVQDNRIGVYTTPRITMRTINQTANEYTEKITYGG